MLSSPRVLRRGSTGIQEHYLLVQIHRDDFGIAADLESGRSTPWVVAAEHAGVDQENLVAKPRPDATTVLHRVADHNVRRLVALQDLARLRFTLLIAPPVVTAKPQRAINPHAEPTHMFQEFLDLSFALVGSGDMRLQLGDNFRL